MQEFIKRPYLPHEMTGAAISAVPIPGVSVIAPPEIAVLPKGIRRHADLGICLLEGGRAVCPPDTFEYYKKALTKFGCEIICGKLPLGSNYPADTAYNVGIAGKNCFVNTGICDSVLLNLLTELGYNIINVKQGYAKCSICPIDENTIICADPGICRAAEKNGMNVLEISNDNIVLEGYSCGFFGGSAGMLSPDTLLVNGELSAIPCGDEITRFLTGRKINVINLKKGAICDIGSIIPLMINVHNI